MKILLLGSGGREHALAWKIAQSPQLDKLYIAPGNAGTANVGENVAIKANDFDAIKAFVLDKKIDMVVVGPEDPLVNGIYDYFLGDAALKDIPVIGPSQYPHRSISDIHWRESGRGTQVPGDTQGSLCTQGRWLVRRQGCADTPHSR